MKGHDFSRAAMPQETTSFVKGATDLGSQGCWPGAGGGSGRIAELVDDCEWVKWLGENIETVAVPLGFAKYSGRVVIPGHQQDCALGQEAANGDRRFNSVDAVHDHVAD